MRSFFYENRGPTKSPTWSRERTVEGATESRLEEELLIKRLLGETY